MKGHEPIIALRRSGLKPAYVWLQDCGLAPTDLCVSVAPTDNPAALDLRFLIGVTVIIESSDERRLRRLAMAASQAKALRTIASHYRRDNGCIDILSIHDSNGELTWPT